MNKEDAKNLAANITKELDRLEALIRDLEAERREVINQFNLNKEQEND